MLTLMCYRVVKETALMEEFEPGAKSHRKLEVGETVEALDLNETKAENGNKGMKVRAAKDSIEGWVTISSGEGEEGTSYLKACGLFYVCIKETVLTTDLSVLKGRTVRRIPLGETIEALDFEKRDESTGVMRIECKFVRDGRKGWAS